MNLAYVRSDGTTILAVDSTSQLSPGENRNSYVRISRFVLVYQTTRLQCPDQFSELVHLRTFRRRYVVSSTV
jgi:hypothetical protein